MFSYVSLLAMLKSNLIRLWLGFRLAIYHSSLAVHRSHTKIDGTRLFFSQPPPSTQMTSVVIVNYSQYFCSTLESMKSCALLSTGKHASQPGINGCNVVLSVSYTSILNHHVMLWHQTETRPFYVMIVQTIPYTVI